MAATPYSPVEGLVSVTTVDATPYDITTVFSPAIIADVVYGAAAGAGKEYLAASAVATAAIDLAAGDITQIVYDQIVAMYAQDKVPSKVTLIKKGAGTYAAALTAAEVAGWRSPWNYTYVLIDSRSDASIVDASDACETRDVLFFGQTDDTSVLDSGLPAGLAGAVNSKTFFVYEDTDATGADAAWVGRIAGQNIDLQRMSGRVRLGGLSEYTTPITAAQEAFLRANYVNYHGTQSPGLSTRAMYLAKTATGRSFSLALALLLSEVRIREALIEVLVNHQNAGDELTDDEVGHTEIRNAIGAACVGLRDPARWIGPSSTVAALSAGWTIDTISVASSAATVTMRLNYIDGIESISVTASLV